MSRLPVWLREGRDPTPAEHEAYLEARGAASIRQEMRGPATIARSAPPEMDRCSRCRMTASFEQDEDGDWYSSCCWALPVEFGE
jgi:hypothetical protein